MIGRIDSGAARRTDMPETSIQPISTNLVPMRPKWRLGALFALEFAALLALVWGWIQVRDAEFAPSSRLFRPMPDAAEHVYVTHAFANGLSPLLPIGNEWRPARYSPVHPALASIWLRLRGGELEAVFSWSSVAALAGALLLWVWAARGGMSALCRILMILLTLYSSVIIAAARGVMQEPTMFLLFALATAAWLEGASAFAYSEDPSERARRNGPRRGGAWLALAGAALGGLFCIRPTTATYPLLLAAALILLLGFRRGSRACLAFAAGATLVIGADMIYIHKIAGIWSVVAYRHWDPEDGPGTFALANLFKAPRNFEDAKPQALMQLQQFLGFDRFVSAAGPQSGVALLMGLALSLAGLVPLAFRRCLELTSAAPRAARNEIFGFQILALALFSISQLAAHAFYFFHDARFFILAYPALVIAGLIGWDRTLRARIAPDASWRGARFAAAWFALILTFTGFPEWFGVVQKLRELGDRPENQVMIEEQAACHRQIGEVVATLKCPVFVDRLPLLGARLSWGQPGFPYPVAPLRLVTELYWDGHIPQFLGKTPAPARGTLDDTPGLWPNDPARDYLWDSEAGLLRADWLDALVAHYGEIVIDRTTWNDTDYDAFDMALCGAGFEIEPITPKGSFRLYRVWKAPGEGETAPSSKR